jgi:hypothetical protein
MIQLYVKYMTQTKKYDLFILYIFYLLPTELPPLVGEVSANFSE